MTHKCVGLAQGLAKAWGVECPIVDKNGTLYYESDRSKAKAAPKKPAAKNAAKPKRTS